MTGRINWRTLGWRGGGFSAKPRAKWDARVWGKRLKERDGIVSY